MGYNDDQLLSEMRELNNINVNSHRKEEIYKYLEYKLSKVRRIRKLSLTTLISAGLACLFLVCIFRDELINKTLPSTQMMNQPSNVKTVVDGQIVTEYVKSPDEPISKNDLLAAVDVVKNVNLATNQRDWWAFISLTYNTFVVPLPKDRENSMIQASKHWETHLYTVGKPYIVRNWSSNFYNFVASSAILRENPRLKELHLNLTNSPANSTKSAYRYHIVFTSAIAVPVTIDEKKQMVLYCVKDQGQWKVAYSWANGYDRGYRQ